MKEYSLNRAVSSFEKLLNKTLDNDYFRIAALQLLKLSMKRECCVTPNFGLRIDIISQLFPIPATDKSLFIHASTAIQIHFVCIILI